MAFGYMGSVILLSLGFRVSPKLFPFSYQELGVLSKGFWFDFFSLWLEVRTELFPLLLLGLPIPTWLEEHHAV